MDKDHKRGPMGIFADAINRSSVGDISALTKGGCLARIVVLVVIMFLLKYFLE